MDRTVLVIGAGLAGARTAEALRGLGHDGRLVLVGDEEQLPYERPPLSKEYLHGRTGFDAALVHPQRWYDDHRVELRTGAHVRSSTPRRTWPPSTTAAPCGSTRRCWRPARRRDVSTYPAATPP